MPALFLSSRYMLMLILLPATLTAMEHDHQLLPATLPAIEHDHHWPSTHKIVVESSLMNNAADRILYRHQAIYHYDAPNTVPRCESQCKNYNNSSHKLYVSSDTQYCTSSYEKYTVRSSLINCIYQKKNDTAHIACSLTTNIDMRIEKLEDDNDGIVDTYIADEYSNWPITIKFGGEPYVRRITTDIQNIQRENITTDPVILQNIQRENITTDPVILIVTARKE